MAGYGFAFNPPYALRPMQAAASRLSPRQVFANTLGGRVAHHDDLMQWNGFIRSEDDFQWIGGSS
jgi:hypothetical protein